MGFSKTWLREQGDTRFIVRANTVDIVVYINWVAETIRQRKVHHAVWFVEWDSWEDEGEPVPIAAFFQLKPGTVPPPGQGNPMGPFLSPSTGDTGHRTVGLWQIAGTLTFAGSGSPSVGTPSSLVAAIDSMKVDWTFDGKPESITIGSNWLTNAAATVVIVIIVFLVVALIIWALA
jgi:hypothetical protein